MKFFIVTPSYNALSFLKLCIASVADQAGPGVEVHHHVQDGASSDGTPGYLKEYLSGVKKKQECGESSGYIFTYSSERDEGMYNAINRGWDCAPDDSDLIAWLNCDEQYLPETLKHIAERFSSDASLDLLFGDMLMLDKDGVLICYRKAHQPHWPMIFADYLYTLSCTMFLRKNVFDQGFRLDEKYKAVADADFVIRMLRAGFKARHFKEYYSCFADTGENLSLELHAKQEADALRQRAPWWVKRGRFFINKFRLFEKLFNGCYHQSAPLSFAVYRSDNPVERQRVVCEKPTWRCVSFS